MCQVEEESIRDNFVICYELLDELIDFGYPQTTDAKILQEYITQVKNSTDFHTECIHVWAVQEGYKLEAAPKPPPAVTNAVSWRPDGIKYRKNEVKSRASVPTLTGFCFFQVFLDVIESVNLLAGASGNVLLSEIVGAIKMRVKNLDSKME